jgi:FtsZ-interacting cell division protein ZipA
MSTIGIIAIVVGVLIILALLAFLLPRMRRQAEVRSRERELEQRRDRVATEHQEVASQREREAQMAEQKAQEAQAAAERQRAEAQMHAERADMHQRGLADDQLIEDHERDRFQPVLEKRNADEADGGSTVTPREGGRAHEPTGSAAAGGGPRASSEYEQGRIDEREERAPGA